MDATQAKFEGWAVVELFGHQREAGFVTTQYFGNAAMFQLDVPELPEREHALEYPTFVDHKLAPVGTKIKCLAVAGRTRLINPSAVYALNPCSETAARKAVEGLVQRKIEIVSLPEGAQLTSRQIDEEDCSGCGAMSGEDHEAGCTQDELKSA